MQPNPYAPPAAPPPAYLPYGYVPVAGNGHITANFVIQIVLGVLHLMCTLGAATNIVKFFDGGFPVQAGDAASEAGQQVGNAIGVFGSAAWGLAGLVWAPLNAYGLYMRRPWGRTSALVYYGISLITCCCTPFGIYGLISLTRESVRAQFQRHP